jgi:predicted Zn-dependent protease
MNDIEGAIKAINEATELNPDKFDIQDTKIQILLYTNKYAETMTLLDDLLLRFPDSEKYIKIKMAYINKNMRRTEGGLDIIEDLIYDYPEDLDILNTKVYFLQYLDRKEEAMETIEELIQKDPDKAMYHDTYGEILMYFENFEKAAEEFQTAVDLEPFGWFAYQTYVKLGICYKELKDYEEAKKYLKMGRDYTNTCSCEYDMKNKWLSIANLFLMEIEQIESEF